MHLFWDRKEQVEKYIAFQDYLGAVLEHICFSNREMRIMAPENELTNVLFSKTIWEP